MSSKCELGPRDRRPRARRPLGKTRTSSTWAIDRLTRRDSLRCIVELKIQPRPQPARCALCHEPAGGSPPCLNCGCVVHDECVAEIRTMCPTIGCAPLLPPRKARLVREPDPPAPAPRVESTRVEPTRPSERTRPVKRESLFGALAWLVVVFAIGLGLSYLLVG